MTDDKIKLNLGCCDLPLEGWVNIDNSTSSHIKADLVADVLNLSPHFSPQSVDEIYAGHLIEHLYPQDADKAVDHWKSLLKPGGCLTLVTPDFRVLVEHYLAGDLSLEKMHNDFTYSYVQESHHRWLYDLETLMELLANHGFKDLSPIDRMEFPLLAYKDSLQMGVTGVK